MGKLSASALLCVLCVSAMVFAQTNDPFARKWTYVSETSAVVYWTLPKIEDAALSYVEYGKGGVFDRKTPVTKEPRWAQFHRLTGLESGATYLARMVNVDPATKKETRSAPITIAPAKKPGAVYIGDSPARPIVLDKPGTTYVLTTDISADGTAIEITAPDVTLDLDGHTVTFGENTDKQVFGVFMKKNEGPAVVCNGHIVQGKRSGLYNSCVESNWRPQPTEIFGISTDVHLKCAYPVRFFGGAKDVKVHHNLLASRVTELESRHYPGNDLLRLDIKGGNVDVRDNLLTEGCHIGIRISGEGPNVNVEHNDIRHHQQYTNGYAFAISCAGADVHHNRVTSSGRAVHMTADGIKLHDNWMDTFNHMDLDDMPAKARPFGQIRVELHGIKFEGKEAKNCKVYGNFMRITQKQPVDSQGAGDPTDKMTNGVYVRSKATALDATRLVDDAQNWEKDRWRNYWAKFAPNKPAVLIKSNDATSLTADFPGGATPGEYTIYQKWDYVPATPLNVACYDPNAMNEVYGNMFVALTTYKQTRHGGYGTSGQWASSIYFVGMTNGPAEAGKYSIWIHDNKFISNDLFASSGERQGVNQTVRIEKNTFELASVPPPTERRVNFANLGEAIEDVIRAGNNRFEP